MGTNTKTIIKSIQTEYKKKVLSTNRIPLIECIIRKVQILPISAYYNYKNHRLNVNQHSSQYIYAAGSMFAKR